MTIESISVTTDDGPMPALLAAPAGGPTGAVVVLQEAFGLTDHIGRVCERLAGAGLLAVAPALFHRQGSPVIAYDDLQRVMPVMATLSAEGITMDLQASVEDLNGRGFEDDAIGVVGFCMGGSLALYTATMRALGAAVTFYGGGVIEGRFGLPPLVDQAPALRAPWLGLYGDLDKGIPPDQVEQLRAAADIAAVDTEIVRYADADHGFNCDDRPAVFNAKAAQDAWGRMLGWFRRLGAAE